MRLNLSSLPCHKKHLSQKSCHLRPRDDNVEALEREAYRYKLPSPASIEAGVPLSSQRLRNPHDNHDNVNGRENDRSAFRTPPYWRICANYHGWCSDFSTL